MGDDWTFVAVDQSSKYVGQVARRGWYQTGSEPRRRVWNARKKVTTLGAITDAGERLFFALDEYLTADHGVALLRALVEEFDDKLVVLLDRAPYFYAKDVWEFVSGQREIEHVEETDVARVRGEGLEVWYFPPHSPELNPVEACWRQFKDWYKYRFFETLEELKPTLRRAFAAVDPPGVVSYICGGE
jgi:hypothetical protein